MLRQMVDLFRRRPFWKKSLFAILFFIFGYLSIKLGAPLVGGWIGCQLVDSATPTEPPDYYVLLMGGFAGDRGASVFEVYQSVGPAPVIFGETEPTKLELAGVDLSAATRTSKYLQKLGIPAHHIQTVSNPYVTSTFDEARAITEAALESGANRSSLNLLVVTNWSHTARAKWIFQRVAPLGLNIQTYANDAAMCSKWWQNEDSAVAVILEYVKWIYYLTHY